MSILITSCASPASATALDDSGICDNILSSSSSAGEMSAVLKCTDAVAVVQQQQQPIDDTAEMKLVDSEGRYYQMLLENHFVSDLSGNNKVKYAPPPEC